MPSTVKSFQTFVGYRDADDGSSSSAATVHPHASQASRLSALWSLMDFCFALEFRLYVTAWSGLHCH
jgi:hypothetical protein